VALSLTTLNLILLKTFTVATLRETDVTTAILARDFVAQLYRTTKLCTRQNRATKLMCSGSC